MINKLRIKNFKSLKDISLDFGMFNLLCGTNSSGKTSIIHSILLLSQSSKSNDSISLNGRLVKLGKFSDVKNFESSLSEEIKISGIKSNKEEFFLNIIETEVLEDLVLKKECKNIESFEYEKNMYYLSANRIGISDVHEAGFESEHFGINGEYTIDYLVKNKDIAISDEYVYDKVKDEASNLYNEVDYWLNRIVGAHIKGEEVEKTNKSVVTFSQFDNEKFVRSIHTGSGISYLISIIITCFGISIISKEKDIIPMIIIENPEIHLHPKAQSMLTEFLIFMSTRMQIIIETQSDHVFNRFRIEIYKRRIKNENLINELGTVHFLKYESNNSIGNRIEFTNDGRVINHKEDLFDQFDIDILRLLGN